jgi:hypothetical protein
MKDFLHLSPQNGGCNEASHKRYDLTPDGSGL